ncbi:uncharacterized protein LOC105699911 isoform X2 [Orussus abietinus]|uniref:uncharacterized protein LOC105699911 isoform X2 n=1 Tax=Orussus abietinus TaxID=222816 RepID=UPI000624F32D|nr:uncharacterized protein LOC105699911 isoform X2 [Orussus abietinus]
MGATAFEMVCLVLLAGLFEDSTQLVIKSINVPSSVMAGETDHVILDCDYDLENTSKDGLVVKWFLNTEDLVFQWIHGSKPLASEIVAKYIDLDYKASNDSGTMYRAMKLNNPDTKLTGEYTCVISTFTDEQTSSKLMVVFSPEEKFDLTVQRRNVDNEDVMEASCSAEGLLPRPTLDISVENVESEKPSKPVVTLRDDQRYDILSRVTLKHDELPESAVVKCVLSIPEAGYNVTREKIYVGTPTATPTATSKLLRKMEIQALNNTEPDSDNGSTAEVLSGTIFLLAAEVLTLSVVYQFYN